jgi:hypothetical protein
MVRPTMVSLVSMEKAPVRVPAVTSLNASNLGSGSVPNARLDSASVTLQGNNFNGASQLVKMGADGKLPAVDGSNLTSVAVAAANVTAGTLTGAFSMDTKLTIVGLTIYGAKTAVQIQALACTEGAGKCLVMNTDDFDLYSSTDSTAGSWRNTRTGVAP